MPWNNEDALKELSANFRLALEAEQFELAEKINNKINELIEYNTKIKA